MTYYAVVSALIFAVVAVGHVIRILNRWAVHARFLVLTLTKAACGNVQNCQHLVAA
jgi:hypothetical protein